MGKACFISSFEGWRVSRNASSEERFYSNGSARGMLRVITGCPLLCTRAYADSSLLRTDCVAPTLENGA